MTLPIVMTKEGPIPNSATTLRNELITKAIALQPGLTTDLPGTLIEDIASTDVGALMVADQIFVDLINSVTPYGANEFLLNQLGQIYGVQQGIGSNTSVYVVFHGDVGYFVPQGTIVSDGTYQYVTQDPVTISSSGYSQSVYAISPQSGSWAVPANTVTTILSSVPAPITLTVDNPSSGIPSSSGQTVDQYRQQVLDAGLVQCSGVPLAIKTALQSVPGVVQTLISVRQVTRTGRTYWEVIVGGGDQYAVANAIFNNCGDPSVLVGSTTTARNVNVSIVNTPDTYDIVYVIPPQQAVTVQTTWATTLTTAIDNASIASLAAQPIVDYINSIGPGGLINIYEIQNIFQAAVASVIPIQFLVEIDIQITIDGSIVSPSTYPGAVVGDDEGYYFMTTSDATFVRA